MTYAPPTGALRNRLRPVQPAEGSGRQQSRKVRLLLKPSSNMGLPKLPNVDNPDGAPLSLVRMGLSPKSCLLEC